MAKTLAEQLAELQHAAEALPAIQAEIKKIEACVGRLNQLLGGQPAAKKGRAAKRGRPAKVAPKITRRGKAKTTVTLKGKLLAALSKGLMSSEQLKKVDGRAVPRTLDKWISQGILKKGPGGRYFRP